MNQLKVNVQQSILTLAAHGWSRRRIARELKLDRATVRRHLEGALANAAISTLGSGNAADSNTAVSGNGETGQTEKRVKTEKRVTKRRNGSERRNGSGPAISQA